jgi:hypothetical protein
MKMKSTSRRPFKYAGAMVQPNAEFSAKSARDVKLLTLMRRAVVAPEPPPEAKQTYKRRDMVAESSKAELKVEKAEPKVEKAEAEKFTFFPAKKTKKADK